MTDTSEGINRIHRALVRACIDYGRAYDLTAADLARYLDDAAKGMHMNAAFKLRGDTLARCLEAELGD
jgi:hypothetical protein